MSEDCPHCLYEKTHANCPGCWEGSHYRPKPSAPRPIHSPVDHYDVDVTTGTVSYHVVRTNGDRIRAMGDEELAGFLFREEPWCTVDRECVHSCRTCLENWLKEEVKDG